MCQVNTQSFDKVATRENNQSLYIYIYGIINWRKFCHV